MVSVKETRIRRKMKELEQKDRYILYRDVSGVAFFLVALLGIVLFSLELPGLDGVLVVSLFPLAGWTVFQFQNFLMPASLFELATYNLFQARKYVTLSRTRKDRRLLKVARHYVTDAILRLEQLVHEAEDRDLLVTYNVQKDLRSGLDALKQRVFPALHEQKQLRDVEKSLDLLTNVFLALDLKKLPDAEEKIIQMLEKRKRSFRLKWVEGLAARVKSDVYLSFWLVSMLVIVVADPVIVKLALLGRITRLEAVFLLVLVVCTSVLTATFVVTSHYYSVD